MLSDESRKSGSDLAAEIEARFHEAVTSNYRWRERGRGRNNIHFGTAALLDDEVANFSNLGNSVCEPFCVLFKTLPSSKLPTKHSKNGGN